MKKYAAEFIGTFALVFAGTGAIVINEVSHGAITQTTITSPISGRNLPHQAMASFQAESFFQSRPTSNAASTIIVANKTTAGKGPLVSIAPASAIVVDWGDGHSGINIHRPAVM